MPSDSYSFLDVAVLDAVRQRFAAGDALAVLTTDLEALLWVNGPGASVFGYDDIESAIGAEAQLPAVARRQVMATRGFPDIGIDRGITLRLSSGMNSRAVAFLASALTMPDGEKAILLAVPALHASSRPGDEIARQAIGGFSGEGHFIALVDAWGGIEAASDGFQALGIDQATLARLVEDVSADARVLRRLLGGAGRSYPAGFARLTDDPARHLLVVVDEGGGAGADDGADDAATKPAGDGSNDGAAPVSIVAPETEAAFDHEEPVVATEPEVQPAPEQPAAQAEADDHGHDHWYFNGDSAHGTVEEQRKATTGTAPAGVADRTALPVRFVWRTDAEGRFSTISPDFARAVGTPAADVIGRSFKDVAAAFGLDPAGEIAGLLERRDTWSGRSVLWPLAGTDLKAPVDLAALPAYGRDRNFEGFRGFGVVRLADATVDDEAIGLALVPNGRQADETVAEEAAAPQPTDPFEGEVPVLAVEPQPDRRFSDKIIRLAEHRQPTNGQPANDQGLSSAERTAFREIGERLKKDNEPAATERRDDTAGRQAPAAGDANEPRETPDRAEAAVGAAAAESGAAATPPGEAEDDSMAEADLRDARDDEAWAEEAGEPAITRPATAGPVTLPGATDDARLTAEAEAPAQPGSLLDYAEPATDGAAAQAPAASPALPDDSMAAADIEDARDDQTLPVVAAPVEDDSTGVAEAATGERAGAPSRADADAPAVPSTEAAPVADLAGEKTSTADAAARPATARPAAAPAVPASGGFVPSAFAGPRNEGVDTSILARLPVPLLIHSGDVLHYANDEFLSLTGYRTLEALEDAGGLDALFVETYEDDSAADGTDRSLRLRGRDGLDFPIEALLRSVPWRGGKALMLVVRRTGEAEPVPAAENRAGDDVQPDTGELKARIAEMRTIIDTATDGVVLIGRDGAIRSISRPAEALFGFDSDDVAGKPFASLFAIESQRAARDYLEGLSEPGVASVLNDGREVIGRESQGRFIPMFMTIGRLPNDSGFCAVVRDITQWKRAEENLTQARAVAERASSQKTEFLARISHEIRTPLNAIIGFSELMVDEKFGPVANDRYRDYLRDINRSGNHVLDLVNDLLDISKIEAGQQEMDYEAVSLNDTLAETVALMQPQANRERVIIRSSFAAKLPDVVADLRSVRQIALNILSNAVRYTQAGGQVIVSTAYEPSGDVVMRVRDTGIGMTQAEIEQALKPFKQINALKRGRGDGTGLGLPLTKAMVEANRARFTITSTPGEGTLVEVAFPSTRVLAE